MEKSKKRKTLLVFNSFIVVCVLILLLMFGIALLVIAYGQQQSITILNANIPAVASAPTSANQLEYLEILQSFYKNATTFDIFSLIYTFLSTSLVGLGLYILKIISKQKEELSEEMASLALNRIEQSQNYHRLLFLLQSIITDINLIKITVTSNSDLQLITSYCVKLLDKANQLDVNTKPINTINEEQDLEIEYYLLLIQKEVAQLETKFPGIISECYALELDKRIRSFDQWFSDLRIAANKQNKPRVWILRKKK